MTFPVAVDPCRPPVLIFFSHSWLAKILEKCLQQMRSVVGISALERLCTLRPVLLMRRTYEFAQNYFTYIIIFWREQDGWQTFIILRRPGLMFRFPCLCTFHCQVYHMNANLFLECSINVRLFLTVDVVYVFNNLSSIILFALKVLL